MKLFHHDSQQAHDHAERIADAVREARHIIPLIDRSGKDTGDSLRISRIETRIGIPAPRPLLFNGTAATGTNGKPNFLWKQSILQTG